MAEAQQLVLGMLVDRRAYGYVVGKRYSELTGRRAHAVYGVLDRLHRDGMIEKVGEKAIGATERGPARVLYAATEAGVVSHRSWIASRPDRTRPRDELELRLAVAGREDFPALLDIAMQQRAACHADLGRFTRRPLAAPGATTAPWGDVVRLLEETRELRWLQAEFDWLEAVCHVLRNEIDRTPRPG